MKNNTIKVEDLKELVSNPGFCFATDRITVDGEKVGFMYREAPEQEEDSGWRFMAGDETQEYMDESGNSGIYALNTIANYDAAIIPYLKSRRETAWERVEGTDEFIAVDFED